MSYEEAVRVLGNDEGFRATVYAMNTLLLKKNVYTPKEFETLIIEYAIGFQRNFSGRRDRVSESAHETASRTL